MKPKKGLLNREYELYSNYYTILNTLAVLTPSVLSSQNDVCSDVKALNDVSSEKKQSNTVSNTPSNELRTLLGEEPTVMKAEKTKEEIVPIVEKTTSTVNTSSFLNAPAGSYTINVTTTNGLEAANKYVSENNLDGANTYSFGPEMKSAKVIYGIFDSVDAAKEAMSKLPSSVIANKPYIDNIAKHQKLYAKYNK
jgi:outer membrane protein, adhesin transport system